MRHAVEVPGAVIRVRAWLAEEKPLAEIPPARQLDLAVFCLVGVACQRIEAFAVLDPRAEQRGTRVEPPQQPVMDVGRGHAPGLDAGVRQPATQAIADDVQHLLGRLARRFACGGPAIDDHAHAPRLAAPAV